MHDPDVVLRIDPQADRLALVHPLRQWFRERGIDLEPRRLRGAARLCFGAVRGSAWPCATARPPCSARNVLAIRTWRFMSCLLPCRYFAGENFCTRLPWCISPV